MNRRVRHCDDPVLNAHVAAARGKLTDRGWRVSKIDQRKPIDALAAVFAHSRVTVAATSSICEHKELLTLGGGY